MLVLCDFEHILSWRPNFVAGICSKSPRIYSKAITMSHLHSKVRGLVVQAFIPAKGWLMS